MSAYLPSEFAGIGFYNDVDAQGAIIQAIERILSVLPVRDKWCVEFGAWDGLHGSCTRRLIVEEGYSSVQIEGDSEKAARLKENYKNNQDVVAVEAFVGFTEADGLDSILAKTRIPFDFDFCCIDIDGNDYHVWNAMIRYKPKVVCIEFNPTIPPEVNFVQEASPSISHGNSLASLVELGKTKGYELVAVISVNAYFVEKSLFPLFQIGDNSISTLWNKRDCVTYFFTGYDGQVFLRGSRRLPWHESMVIEESQAQVIPKFLRTYPSHRRAQTLYKCIRNPLEIIAVLKRRLNKKTD